MRFDPRHPLHVTISSQRGGLNGDIAGCDRHRQRQAGIVERLSDVVLAAEANWEESRMARLAGKFAGILRISVAAANADALASGLRAVSRDGLTVVVESSGEAPAETFRTVRLELVGNDHPGIIRDISKCWRRTR